MMNFLFNEQSAIENMIQMKVVDDENIFSTIKDLARYNYFIKNMEIEDNYKHILDYLTTNGKDINEENVYQIIDDCVRRAKKYQFKTINEVLITKSELQFIENLNDIKKEKIAFVLLASAKYYDAMNDTQKSRTYMRNSDICKLARVTIPVDERNLLMQFTCDEGVLQRHTFAGSIVKNVAFVSYDSNDEIVLRLNEGDYKDLAYTYLHYKTPRQYRRCHNCKKWIRVDKNNRQYCKECSSNVTEDKPTIQMKTCIDCGCMFQTSIKDAHSCRCKDCQNIIDKENTRLRIQQYRDKHNM